MERVQLLHNSTKVAEALARRGAAAISRVTRRVTG